MSAELLRISRQPKDEWQRLERGLFRYVPTGEIWVRKTFTKEMLPDLRANTCETTIGKARTQAQILVADWRARHKSGIVVGRTIGDVIAEVLRVVTPTKRLGTKTNHRIYLGELREELGHFPINDFSRAAWSTWFTQFRSRKSRNTFGDYAKHMNLVLRYAYNNRMAQHLVTIPNPDGVGQKAGRVFSVEEIERLGASAITQDARLQFALCYGCGMRLREALHLTWDRIDLETGLLTLRAEDVKTGTRTGKGRKFFVTKEALSLLRAQRGFAIASPFVFPSPTDANRPQHQNKTAWGGIKRRAGIRGRARWHDLRHSRITHLLFIYKLSIEFVSEYVGTSIATLQRIYMHCRPEDTRSVSEAPTIPERK